MIVIKCPIRGCEHQTPDRPCDPVYSFLNLRKEEHQQDSGLTNNGMEPNSGSRFLNGAEKNYDVIAGESLTLLGRWNKRSVSLRDAEILWLLRVTGKDLL